MGKDAYCKIAKSKINTKVLRLTIIKLLDKSTSVAVKCVFVNSFVHVFYCNALFYPKLLNLKNL